MYCARSRTHHSHHIGSLKRPDSTTTINDTERADLFNKFVRSLFVPDDDNSLFPPRTGEVILIPIFSVSDIRKSLSASSSSISCSPDSIPPYF